MGPGTQKLSLSHANMVKSLLKNTKMTFAEIANSFKASIYCISDINSGRTFHDNNIQYPIRSQPKRSVLNSNKIDIIIDMLLRTQATQEQIAEVLNINEYTVGEINRGTNNWRSKDIEYPIRKPIQKNTFQNKITQKEVQEICYKLCFSNIKIEDIGKE